MYNMSIRVFNKLPEHVINLTGNKTFFYIALKAIPSEESPLLPRWISKWLIPTCKIRPGVASIEMWITITQHYILQFYTLYCVVSLACSLFVACCLVLSDILFVNVLHSRMIDSCKIIFRLTMFCIHIPLGGCHGLMKCMCVYIYVCM